MVHKEGVHYFPNGECGNHGISYSKEQSNEGFTLTNKFLKKEYFKMLYKYYVIKIKYNTL